MRVCGKCLIPKTNKLKAFPQPETDPITQGIIFVILSNSLICWEHQPFQKGIILSLLIEKITKCFNLVESFANVICFPPKLLHYEMFANGFTHTIYKNVKVTQKRESFAQNHWKMQKEGNTGDRSECGLCDLAAYL